MSLFNLSALILCTVVLGLALLMQPRLAHSANWRATVTPLASIIGSGFLVLGPLLNASYGEYAGVVMLALCLGAYGFGSAIRFNIRVIAATPERTRVERALETASGWALAFAYVISVTYYLNLFGAFGVRLTPANEPNHARLLTSAVLIVIMLVGWTRGFNALEHMEQFAVTVKLAIIGGLLVGLSVYFADAAEHDALNLTPPQLAGLPAITLALGLIITVQGFEISRYLGDRFDAERRIRSMRWAQWLAGVIYILYTVLFSLSFDQSRFGFSETAIIDMLAIVAPILPVLLIAAALSAQFSAAIADTAGSGGLIAEMTRGVISERAGYVGLVMLALIITWNIDIFEIISAASRAFALYYALQATLAAHAAWRLRGQCLSGGGIEPTRVRQGLWCYFGLFAVLALASVLFAGTAGEH